MKYKVNVPPTAEQGSYTTIVKSGTNETINQQALWDYNSARAHDGLPSIKRMPNGTTYAAIKEWVLWANYGYGHGWEEETIEESYKAAREQIKCYRKNAPMYNYKITSRPKE